MEITGLYYKEKGVIKRKTRKRGRGIGRKRERSNDTRIEYREMRYYTKRGLRTRRMWLSEEPLPLIMIRGKLGKKGEEKGIEKGREIKKKNRSERGIEEIIRIVENVKG